MSDGKWSGGTANRQWARPGSRVRNVPGDRDRAPRLYEALAGEDFWCDTCEAKHPLREHRDCRATARMAILAGRPVTALPVTGANRP